MKVAVIAGGPSREAQVSRRSAHEVMAALRVSHTCEVFEFESDLSTKLFDMQPDVAVPIMHGSPGEDGTIQGFLNVLEIPFVGSDVEASALAMDKFGAKCMWRDAGLPVLPTCLVSKDSFTPSCVQDIESQLGSAVAIKPRSQGSALGVQLLPEAGDMRQAIAESFKFDDHLVIEPFVDGREITVGVLERHNRVAEALPVIEIHVSRSDEWYDYTNRYTPGKSRHEIDPKFQNGVAEELRSIAVQAHEVLRCRDLSRSDFLVTPNGEICLLELNTIPGMTATSLYPDAARAAGLELPALMDLLVENAIRRNTH